MSEVKTERLQITITANVPSDVYKKNEILSKTKAPLDELKKAFEDALSGTENAGELEVDTRFIRPVGERKPRKAKAPAPGTSP